MTPLRGKGKSDRCENPACRKPLDPQRVTRHNARTCDAKCRAAAWKAKERYGRGQAPALPRANASRPGGVTVAYGRMLQVLGDHFTERGEDAPFSLAHELIHQALTDKARARLRETGR